MPNADFFQSEFDKLATNGCIGDPLGRLAYAYLRVSSDEQADEGRSGLPRQISHVHEIARVRGYRIPWDYVFADDSSGFEFEERLQLGRLRREFKSATRRTDAVVIEHLDRLSRDADWHQGYLLHEMEKAGVTPVFWKEFSSRIERAVLGAIAQEGMEQEKKRMMEGTLYKARSGRVTARVPAYGYKLVDSQGNEGQSAKRDTHYGIREDEAVVVRMIFERYISGATLQGITRELHASGIKPPKQYKHWWQEQVRVILTNPVYRGDFYAHRWEHKVIEKPAKDGMSTRKVKLKVERPPEEWIRVPVPPIVSLDVWNCAERMLQQNKKMAPRNAKEPYLLTGLIKCAYCGWSFAGNTTRKCRGKVRKTPSRMYRCSLRANRPKYVREDRKCYNRDILCRELDAVVWEIVCTALLEPTLLLNALDADATSERNAQLQEHISFLEKEIWERSGDDEKLLKAYLAGAFDEKEFAERRKLLKQEVTMLHSELARIQQQVLTKEQLESRKQAVLAMSERIKQENLPVDPPFELKQKIIKLVIDKVIVDVPNDWIRVEGAIQGKYSIETALVGMDCGRRSAGSSPGR
jgi:site-specific DNA recombinase